MHALNHNQQLSYLIRFEINRAKEITAFNPSSVLSSDLGMRRMTGLLSGISDQISREINSHVVTKKEFLKRKTGEDHFLSQILESPKLFIIGNEHELAGLA